MSAGDESSPARDHRGIRSILYGELLVPQLAGGGTGTSNVSHAHRGVRLSSVTNIAWRSNLAHLVLGLLGSRRELGAVIPVAAPRALRLPCSLCPNEHIDQ